MSYFIRRRLPTCSCCNETINTEFLYDVGQKTHELLCEDCIKIFCEENYRYPTEKFIEEEIEHIYPY